MCVIELAGYCIPLGTVLGGAGVGLLAALWAGQVISGWMRR